MDKDKANFAQVYTALQLPQCRYMMCWTVPFAVMTATPFALIFSYYNSQNQQNFKKWHVKTLGRDLLLFWGAFALYGTLRTFFLDPYCDPKSIHYNRELNAFERKKFVIEGMKKVLIAEGKPYPGKDIEDKKD